jgi:hypothetical protein
MTIGFVVVSARPVEGQLLAHERHHVRQYCAWGPLFIPVYLLWRSPTATVGIRWRSRPSARPGSCRIAEGSRTASRRTARR